MRPEAAALEQTTGNYSYGNVSWANATSNMRQSDQWSVAPSFMGGSTSVGWRQDNGAVVSGFGNGQDVIDTGGAISRLGFTPTMNTGTVSEWREMAKRADIRQEISASLREPDLVDVSRTSVGGEGDVRAAYRPHWTDAIHGGRGQGNPDAAATIIAGGRRAVGEDKAIAEAGRASRIQGAVDVQSEVGDSHNKGFFLDPKLRD